MSLTRELIEAASSGNLARLKELVEQFNVDINGIYKEVTKKKSAIGEAIKNNQVAVIDYLLQKNADFMQFDESRRIDYESAKTSGYVIACDTHNISLDTFKRIIKKVPFLNPHVYTENISDTDIIHHLSLKSNWDENNKVSYVSKANLIFHEAILRHDTQVFDASFKHRMYKLSLNSLNEYLRDSELSSNDVERALQSLNYLYQKKIVSLQDIETYTAILKSCIRFKLEVDAFPHELQKSLGKAPPQPLAVLTAELASYLYPEEELPPIPISSDTYQAMHHVEPKNEEERKAIYDREMHIKYLQDPLRLRELLALENAAIMLRLSHQEQENGENPAAVLLAQIILFHAKDCIHENNKPFLDEKLQAKGIQVLSDFYKLSTESKMNLNMHRQTYLALAEVNMRNQILEERLNGLLEETVSLKGQLAEIHQLLTTHLIQNASNISSSAEQTNTIRMFK